MATATAIAAAVAAAGLILVVADTKSTPPVLDEVGAGTSRPPSRARRAGARENCSTRSEASFPGAFTDAANLVVGPLVLIGGASTDASTVREFGGNKFPLLVKAGHTVTIRLALQPPQVAGLAYGPLPQGRETKLRDTYRSVTFVACRPGKATRRYRPNGPSGSYADGENVTFWSGSVLTRAPACLPLDVYIDGASSPQRVGLALGRPCGQ
jgi:hypothetical protein